MVKVDFKDLYKFLQDNWYKRSTIIIILLSLCILFLWLFSVVEFEKYSIANFIVIFLLLVVALIIWKISTRIPKTNKGKVGFAVAINYETKEEEEKITQDFTRNLKQLLSNSTFRYHFDFIEIPKFYSNKINNMDDARYYLRISKAHFMIFGTCKKRVLNNKEHHIINLNGLVTHRPLPNEIQKLISFEFKELFPRKLLVPFENDLFAFEFTSELITIVSKYIIALAALLSGDINYSQQLLEGLYESSGNIKSNIPSLAQIKKRLPSRLLEVYLIQIRILMLAWRKSRDINLMHQIKPFLDKIETLFPNEYNSRVMRAIYYFITDNLKAAKNEIRKCRNASDQVWRFNYAFLFAYEGNLKQAYRIYKSILKKKYSIDTVFEVEEFIIWVLQEKPHVYQLYFCLGVINYYFKEDVNQAKLDFMKFTELSKDNYPEETDIANKLIDEIEIKINDTNS